MKTIEMTLVAAACMLVVAGCGFLKKDRIPEDSETGSSSGADAGAAQEAAGPDGEVTEQQVKSHPPSDSSAKGSAAFNVKRDGDVPPGYGIVPGDYSMLLGRASVVTGTAGGLSVEFESLDDKNQKRTLSIMMASSSAMSIWYTYEGGETLHFKHPHLPFTLTEGDYPSDPHDARGRTLAIGPVVTQQIKEPGATLSSRFIYFNKFKLKITEAAVDDEKLTMSCTFCGESVPDPYQPFAVYSISGSFKIAGEQLGMTFKD
jgi:hypothetical protein